jgi:hypothetical protein
LPIHRAGLSLRETFPDRSALGATDRLTYVPFFDAFGTAWDDAMVARWSANPLGISQI